MNEAPNCVAARRMGPDADHALRSSRIPLARTCLIELSHQLPGGISVWHVDLDKYAATVDLAGCSASELESARRKVFERDRMRQLAARHALRQVLGDALGIAPAAVTIGVDDWGKPTLSGQSRLEFNLSHSENVALIGISRVGPIGVDLEVIRSITDARELACLHFTDVEREAWTRQDAASERAFLTCWTRKEACLKALGVGLSAQPSAVDAGCSSQSQRVVFAAGNHRLAMTVHSIAVPGDAVAAVALATSADVTLARQSLSPP